MASNDVTDDPMSDQSPFPRASGVYVEVAVFANDATSDTLATVQVRAITTDGETVGFSIPADMAVQVATMLRTAGRGVIQR